jgi:hypothetical protein
MPLVVVRVAGTEESLEIGEVVVDRRTLHAGALGDGLDRCLRRPDRFVQLDRRFDDPLPGLGLGQCTLRLPVRPRRRYFR